MYGYDPRVSEWAQQAREALQGEVLRPGLTPHAEAPARPHVRNPVRGSPPGAGARYCADEDAGALMLWEPWEWPRDAGKGMRL